MSPDHSASANEPHDGDAERALLGALLFDSAAVDDVSDLRPECFYEPLYGRLFDAIRREHAAGRRADAITLANAFRQDQALTESGGLRFLVDLVDHAPPVIAVQQWAAVIRDGRLRRDLIDLAQAVAAEARDTPESAISIVERAESSLADLARDGADRRALAAGVDALKLIDEAAAGGQVLTSTGMCALDRVMGGLSAGQVVVVAGRTSMGKTLLGLNVARAVAAQGRGVLLVSLEPSKPEVQARLICDLAYDTEARWDAGYAGNPAYGDVLKGRCVPGVLDKARAAAVRLAELPIVVSDVAGVTVDEIRAQARRQMRAWERGGVPKGALVIDHIGFIRPTHRTDSKVADTNDIVNGLPGLAKQIGAPIIALAQINRQPEARVDHRPTLADLAWSGAIEQVADVVILLYREAYYLERSSAQGDWDRAQARKHDLELIVAKNRQGPICTVKAFVDAACNAVRDLPDARSGFR